MCSFCGNSFWRVGDHLLPSRHFFYACSGAVMSFAQLALAPRLLENLQALGYQQPTPIQQAAIPPMLAGKDLMADTDSFNISEKVSNKIYIPYATYTGE